MSESPTPAGPDERSDAGAAESPPESDTSEASVEPRPARPVSPLVRTLPVVRVVAVLVALLGLLWGADAVARVGATTLLARNVQDATGAAETPVVELSGRFFLPQVIRGVYTEVQVSTRGITSGPLRITQVDSQLFDVRVPFHDVLVQDIREVGIGRSVERVDLRYDDLNRYFDGTGRSLRLGAGPQGRTTLTGELDVLGRKIGVNAEVTLAAEDGALRITPEKVETSGGALNRANRLLLDQRLRFTVPLGTLPFGHQLREVDPYAEGLRLAATGRTIILRP